VSRFDGDYPQNHLYVSDVFLAPLQLHLCVELVTIGYLSG